MSREGGGVAEFQRAGEAEQLIPLAGDEAGLDGSGEQRPGVRKRGEFPGGAEPVELQTGQVTDPR